MRRLSIALAIFMASPVVCAQSSVQIYGSIDLGFTHRGDNIQGGIHGKNSIDSGITEAIAWVSGKQKTWGMP